MRDKNTAISPLYKLMWPLHVRIPGNWAESISTHFKDGTIVRFLGDTETKMAPSLCWDFKLFNEGSFVEIGQEMTKLGWKVSKKSLQSLRAELQSLRAESIAVCMQRWSFRRRSLSWETSFDWSEMKFRALPGVSPHPAVRTWPGFQVKWTQPDFSWFFMRDHTCSWESRWKCATKHGSGSGNVIRSTPSSLHCEKCKGHVNGDPWLNQTSAVHCVFPNDAQREMQILFWLRAQTIQNSIFWQTISLAVTTLDNFLLFPAYIWKDNNISTQKLRPSSG